MKRDEGKNEAEKGPPGRIGKRGEGIIQGKRKY